MTKDGMFMEESEYIEFVKESKELHQDTKKIQRDVKYVLGFIIVLAFAVAGWTYGAIRSINEFIDNDKAQNVSQENRLQEIERHIHRLDLLHNNFGSDK